MSLNGKIWSLAIFVLVGSGALTWSAKSRPAPRPAPAARGAAGEISATGKIEALKEASIRAKGGGRILKWLKTEGEWAKEGELVLKLDQDAEKAALLEAEAEVFQTESRLKRIKILHAQKVASDQEADDAEGAFRLARARKEKASAALAERNLRAPFSGKILKTYLEPGESIEARGESPLFVIGDIRTLRVRAEIDELDIERIAAGNPAVILPDAYPGREVPGKVASMSGILGRRRLRSDDPKERLDGKVLEVLIELQTGEGLRPGLSAEVRIKGNGK